MSWRRLLYRIFGSPRDFVCKGWCGSCILFGLRLLSVPALFLLLNPFAISFQGEGATHERHRGVGCCLPPPHLSGCCLQQVERRQQPHRYDRKHILHGGSTRSRSRVPLTCTLNGKQQAGCSTHRKRAKLLSRNHTKLQQDLCELRALRAWIWAQPWQKA